MKLYLEQKVYRMSKNGKIIQVIGAVVDVQFEGGKKHNLAYFQVIIHLQKEVSKSSKTFAVHGISKDFLKFFRITLLENVNVDIE